MTEQETENTQDSDISDWVPSRYDVLSERSVDLLLVLDSHDGATLTTEARDALGYDETAVVRYEVRMYLDGGENRRELVTKTSTDIDAPATPPKVLQLTPDGEEIVRYIQEYVEGEDAPIRKRVDRSEMEIRALRQRLDEFGRLEPAQVVSRATNAEEIANELEETVGEIEETVDQNTKGLSEVAETVDRLAREQENFAERLSDLETEVTEIKATVQEDVDELTERVAALESETGVEGAGETRSPASDGDEAGETGGDVDAAELEGESEFVGYGPEGRPHRKKSRNRSRKHKRSQSDGERSREWDRSRDRSEGDQSRDRRPKRRKHRESSQDSEQSRDR